MHKEGEIASSITFPSLDIIVGKKKLDSWYYNYSRVSQFHNKLSSSLLYKFESNSNRIQTYSINKWVEFEISNIQPGLIWLQSYLNS